MNVILRVQLGQRLIAPDSSQCNLCIEYRRVIPSGSLCHLFCSYCAFRAFSCEQNFHLTACLNFRNHLYKESDAIWIFTTEGDRTSRLTGYRQIGSTMTTYKNRE